MNKFILFLLSFIFVIGTKGQTNPETIIPVVVNVFHDGDVLGTGNNLTYSQIDQVVQSLNVHYASGIGSIDQEDSNISFVLADKDVNGNQFIDDITGSTFNGYRSIDFNDYPFGSYTGQDYTAVANDGFAIVNAFGYETSNYLNIYVINWTGDAAGFTFLSAGYTGGYFVDPYFFLQTSQKTNAHEIGHFFGLYHSFNKQYNQPNGTNAESYFGYLSCLDATLENNCQTQGDLVCDTPPQVAILGACSTICLGFVNNGNGVDPRNIMSYSGCNDYKFTSGQIARMHAWISNFRSNMAQNGANNYGSTDGCTDSSACNYNSNAINDDGSCLFEDAIGVCGGSCATDIDDDDICDNVDNCVGQVDAIGVCNGTCQEDVDLDGICDDVDDCVGTLDACGICNGPGAIYDCGCEGIPAGDCDCNGNQLDALGVCGGDCVEDLNNNGVCDNQEDCVSENYHGYEYDLALFGSTCWFTENLRTTMYTSGVNINELGQGSEWSEDETGAYYNPLQVTDTLGFLYNWYAINEGVCPIGWRVPSDQDWKNLEDELGLNRTELNAVGNRGESQDMHTQIFASEFDPVYAGVIKDIDGIYYGQDLIATYWTSDSHFSLKRNRRESAWSRAILDTKNGIARYNDLWQTSKSKGHGMSVRCVYDVQ